MAFNPFKYYEELRSHFGDEGARVFTEIVSELYREVAQTVTREDFRELKAAVEELTTAQRETQRRLNDLAEAQRETERKLKELTKAQGETEREIKALAEAQRRTEERVGRLEEAVKGLTEAQEETEREIKALAEEVRLLASEHRETRRQPGGLAITVGYRLEDEAFKALPRLLERDYGLKIRGKLKRTFVSDVKGRPVEVNIFGEAEKDGERFTIVGEGKSQLSKRDVDRFIRRKIKPFEGLFRKIFPVVVTYMISEPKVEDYVKQKGIALYYSFEF